MSFGDTLHFNLDPSLAFFDFFQTTRAFFLQPSELSEKMKIGRQDDSASSDEEAAPVVTVTAQRRAQNAMFSALLVL